MASLTETGEIVLGGLTETGELVLGSVAAPVAPPVGFRAPRRRPALPPIHYTIDGQEVLGTDASWSSALTGFERATVRAAADGVSRGTQGSVLEVWTRDGEPVWEGRMSSDPWVEGGLASLEASGYRAIAAKAAGRLLYQSRDLEGFQAASDPPYGRTAGSTIPARVETAALVWEGSDGVAGSGDLAFWANGSPGGITRIAWARRGLGAVVLSRFDGPTGPLTTVGSFSASTVDTAISPAQDAISVTAPDGTRLSEVRVNGIAVGDRMTTSEIVADIGRRLGFDTTGVEPSAINALPYDLQTGPWVEAFDYLASLDDWVCLVLDDVGAGPRVVYRPWGRRVWDVALADGALVQLAALEVFNRVRVWYSTSNGVLQAVEKVSDPDPLAFRGIDNTFEYAISDTQPDDSLAQAIASRYLDYLSRPRFRGQIELAVATADDGGTNPFTILPGDLVRITDFALGTSLELRIHTVQGRPDRVVLGIEMEALPSLAGLAVTPGAPARPRVRNRFLSRLSARWRHRAHIGGPGTGSI